MVVTRSMRKSEPEIIELSSTEEDDVNNEEDYSIISERSSESLVSPEIFNDLQRSNIQEDSPKTNELTAGNNVEAADDQPQSIDLYIPKSNFNIHIVDDEDFILSRNVLLKHQLKSGNSSFSLKFDKNCLIVNELDGQAFKQSNLAKRKLVLSKNNAQHGLEGSEEFFSAHEDNTEMYSKDKMFESDKQLMDDDSDDENPQGKQEDNPINDSDIFAQDKLSSQKSEERIDESDINPSESQSEPLVTYDNDNGVSHTKLSVINEQKIDFNNLKDKKELNQIFKEQGIENSILRKQNVENLSLERLTKEKRIEASQKKKDLDAKVFKEHKLTAKQKNKNPLEEANEFNIAGFNSENRTKNASRQSSIDFGNDAQHEAINDKSISASEDFVDKIDSKIPSDTKSVSLNENEAILEINKKNSQNGSDSKLNISESGSDNEKLKPSSSLSKPIFKKDVVDDEPIIDDPKENIDKIMRNDMFAYVSSSDEEQEEEEEENFANVLALPKKRTADEVSDEDIDEFSEYGSKKQKNNDKIMTEVDMFFDDNLNDDLFDLPSTKVLDRKTSDVKDAKKALAALIPSLSQTQVVKRRSIPPIANRTSTLNGEKSPSITTENSSVAGQSESISASSIFKKDAPSQSPVDSDEKVKVTFISQLTGFSKCIVIVSLKKKKTLRSISDKIIKTIMKQRPGSVYTYSSDDCSFYHKGVKLNKFNTIADIKMEPSKNNIEITIVSADVEKELFKTNYEKMKVFELEEGKLKKMNDQMDLVDANFNQIDEELKKMEAVAAERYTEEIGEVVAAEDEPVDDGKFSIKLLDKNNNPLIIRVTGDMTIANVLEIYKNKNVDVRGLKIIIMFDGDVVELTDTLDDLGLEEDDMLEFVFK